MIARDKKIEGLGQCVYPKPLGYDDFLFACGVLHLFVILLLLKTVIMLIYNPVACPAPGA